MPFPDIDPVAFTFGPFVIRWYALAYIGGFLGGWWICRKLIENEHLWGDIKRPTSADVDDLMVAVPLGIVLGGRIGYVLFYQLPYYLENPVDIVRLWDGGMSFHGGLLGCAFALFILSYLRKLNPLTLVDIVCVSAPVGLFLGRIANFINGELWGRVAENFAFAVVFPDAGPYPRHPSQLYEAFSEGILLFLVMLWAVRRFGFIRPGLIAGIFGVGYGVARIVCEFFRQPDVELGFLFGDTIAFLNGGITMGMLLSLPLILLGTIVIILAAKGRTRKTPFFYSY